MGIDLYCHPTAGYLLNLARGRSEEPGSLDHEERLYLRGLAEQLLELAGQPEQADKRENWYRHNALGRGRPLMLLFPENAWEELLPEEMMRVRDSFWRNQEWYLRHLLYRSVHFRDDFVVEPELVVATILRRSSWGLESTIRRPEQYKGAYKIEAPLQTPDNVEQLVVPTVTVDQVATTRVRDALGEVFGDLLAIRIACRPPHANLIGEAAGLRGMDRLMMDMYDRPAWVHRLMDRLADAVVAEAESLESGGYLTLNNRGHYNDSGGIGYCRELPSAGFDGRHVRLRDLWGFGVAQEMVSVGPRQHAEFLLDYQLRLLERFGLNAYGCCEPYTTKYDMLGRVPRLRRVSVSPWSDLEVAARRLGDRCIYSWKPNPAWLVGGFDPEAIRATIRHTLSVARGCILEMILKDTYTVEFRPERLDVWSRIAREEIEAQA